jgi:hypothetical protein
LSGELRSLSFIVELIDKATKPLQNVIGISDALQGRKTNIEVGASTSGAITAFSKLEDSIEALSDIGESLGETTDEAGQKISAVAHKTMQAWEPTSDIFQQVGEAAAHASNSFEEIGTKTTSLTQKSQSLVDALGGIKYQLVALETAAGAFMYSAVGAAMSVERLETITKGTFGDRAQGILDWADAGEKLTGVTKESRLEMARLFNQSKMGNDQIITASEVVEKYWKNKALRAKLQASGVGSKEDLAEQIKNVEIGGGRATALRQIWGKDKLDDVIQYGHGAKKVLSLMQKDLKNTADTEDDTMSAQADLAESWDKLGDEAGKGLLPVFTKIFQGLNLIVGLLRAIPGGPAIAGLAAGVAFLSISLILLGGMLAQSYLALGKFAAQLGITSLSTAVATLSTYAHAAAHKLTAGAMWLSTAATYAWGLAQTAAAGAVGLASGAVGALTGALTVLKAAMLSNPITAAFVILLAVLILLETKFHIFSNLFKSLEKVNWAEKWASSVAYLTGLWDGLLDRVSWVKNLVSGGGGLLSKIGGGNIALGGLMVAIPGIGIMIGLLKMMYGAFKYLLDLTGGSTQFLKDIYNELRKQFEKALNFLGSLIPGWLKGLSEGLDGFANWLRNAWDRLIAGINSFLASLGLSQIEGAKKGSPEENFGLTAADKKRILDENLTAYNIDQAAGSQLGTPAIGAGEVKNWQPAFEGAFEKYNFESSRYPGVTRTGKELTQEQLLSGEWTPKNAVDEFGGFAGALSQAQIDAFNAKIEAAKAVQTVVTPKVEVTVTESQQKAKEKLASRPEPKAGEDRTDEQYASDKQDAIDAGIVEEGSPSYKGSEITSSNWNWGSQPKTTAVSSPAPAAASVLPDATDMLGGGDKGKSTSSPSSSSESGKSSSSSESGKSSSSSESGKSSTPSAPAAPSAPATPAGFSAPAAPEAPSSDFESPTFDSGGRVGKTGKAIVHEGEEVVSEEDKTAVKIGVIPSVLQGISEISTRLREETAASQSISPSASIPVKQGDRIVNLNFYSPLVRIEKIANSLDLDRMQTELIKFLRSEIKSAMKG